MKPYTSYPVCLWTSVIVHVQKYMYACMRHSYSKHVLFGSKGDWALENLPAERSRIEQVQIDPAFEVTDLAWICATLQISARCTISPDVYKKVHEEIPNLEPDVVFGDPDAVSVHLLFSWQQSVADVDHHFVHWDLLVPTDEPVFAFRLPQDATQMHHQTTWMQPCFFLYIYI